MSDRDGKRTNDIPSIPMLFDPMEQMRELLFGATKRETDGQLTALEAKVEEMRKELLARFESLESRLAEIARDSEKRDAQAFETIGGAISDLGASIRNMGAKRNV